MPKRLDIKSILVIGAGPIVIGQACEFDYSGTQACKALKAEGYRIILVNSNPATIMTDPDLADSTYIEPITPECIETIIALERPDALLPTVGGQTALNCALALADNGVLEKYKVEMIGANRDAIRKAENRLLFSQAMEKIGLEVTRYAVIHSLEEARVALEAIGLPAIIRASFTLGGTGSGIAYNKEEFEHIILSGLEASPIGEVIIDASVLGWKEYEMEVVRDKADNIIIVCTIENIDPMGVHTGDSITVAPAMTLRDKEYQKMRNASIAVLREIGVETGGSNVQFAINPKDGRMVVIEMNPRVSRSSALASKATGYPIAKIAAKLAVGYRLDELMNDCTKNMPASFEPMIDYVVTKIPRFAFEKFKSVVPTLGSSMKSVGEVMAIGRSFSESLQKALRSLETGLHGLNGFLPRREGKEAIKAALSEPTPDRLLVIADAFRQGLTLEEINQSTSYDPWFLGHIQHIIQLEKEIKKHGLPKDKNAFHFIKKQGFSDAQLADIVGLSPHEVTQKRHHLGIRPVYKRIDSCGAEFDASTAYMYGCYEALHTENVTDVVRCEALPSEREKIIIIGSGPNRIGQGIEFDYCCVHASYALKEVGYETIMINCNPETVSTDYDTSDRLYFEPITKEDVLEIIHVERKKGTLKGVIVQLGGQTPLKLCKSLEEEGIPILGTSPSAIHRAEDRAQFKECLLKLNLLQPENDTCLTREEAIEKAGLLGFPLVIRPSYVLGGASMEIIYNQDSLESYIDRMKQCFATGPLLLDRFLEDAIEIDVDALCDKEDIWIAAITEHIEEAGIHSGDSACSLPPHSLSAALMDEIIRQSTVLAKELAICGFMNVQFAIQNEKIYILEVNPRASRTIPFIAKALQSPIAKWAARIIAGETIRDIHPVHPVIKHVAVKKVAFPFARFPEVDVLLGPEMRSTGETMGIDSNFDLAYAKAHIASGEKLPLSGTAFLSVRNKDKPEALKIAQALAQVGFRLVATKGTALYLQEKGLDVEIVNKVLEGRPHIVDLMKDDGVDLVINTTQGAQAIIDSFSIRRTALLKNIVCSTTISGSHALVKAIKIYKENPSFSVRSLQSYMKDALR